MLNHEDQSSFERSQSMSIANMSMAFSQLADLVGAHLPAMQTQIRSIQDNLNSNLLSAMAMAISDDLEGRGVMASHYRRTKLLLVHAEPVVIEQDIQRMLPQKVTEKSDGRIYREHVWRLMGRFEPYINNAMWIDNKFKLPLTLDSWIVREEPLEFYSLKVENVEPGLYWKRVFSSYDSKKRILVVRVSPSTIVLVEEDTNDVVVFSWIAIERVWARHTDLRYVDFEQFCAKYKEIYDRCNIWPDTLDTAQLITAVQTALELNPLKSIDKETWKELTGYKGTDRSMMFRKCDGEYEDNDLSILIYTSGYIRLTFHFNSVDPEKTQVIMSILPKRDNNYGQSPAYPVTNWEQLPVYNKITLAQDLLDMIVRVHKNENRPVVEEPSSEPTAT